MVYIVRTEEGDVRTVTGLREAEKCFEEIKNTSMSNVVSFDDSFVELYEAKSETDEDIDNAVLLKRVVPVVDEKQYKEFGTPEENGMDFQYWAKWKEEKIN